MPFWRFTVATFFGCLIWISGLTLIGRSVGSHWVDWKDKFHYVDYAVALFIVVAAAWLVVRWWRGRGDSGSTGVTESVPEG